MKESIFTIILLSNFSVIYQDKKGTHTKLSIYLSLLFILYLILSKIPNFEHFKIYDDKDSLLNIYQTISEESIDDIKETENSVEGVKYGDTLLIKCLSKEDRYLMLRGGNMDTNTNDLNEHVFTTNENDILLKWIIKDLIQIMINKIQKKMNL